MSIYLLKSKALIVHIPKTGGTWVQRACDFLGVRKRYWYGSARQGLPRIHATIPQLSPAYRGSVKRTASFVRHPLSFYESLWCYLKPVGVKGRNGLNKYAWHPLALPADIWCNDFNIWIERMLWTYPLYYTRLVELYLGPEGGEYVRYIGRTENLVDDFCEIMCELGYEEEIEVGREGLINLGLVNSRREGVKVCWRKDLRLRVLQDKRSVIQRFYSDLSYSLQTWSPQLKDLERGFEPDWKDAQKAQEASP